MKNEGNIIVTARKVEKIWIEIRKITFSRIHLKNLFKIDFGLSFDSYQMKQRFRNNNKRRNHHVWLAIENRVDRTFW
jgi:methylphosphotriester-DNA--protein-cysteine methyltransferase